MVVVRTVLVALLVWGFGESRQVHAQDAQGGAALELTKKWDLPRAWAVSIGPATELRPLYDGDGDDAPPNALRNLDLNLGVQRRWFERWTFGTGLRARRRYALSDDPARELRSWWYATRTGAFRYVSTAQRFRTEQRWRGQVAEELDVSYRHRYFIGFERALSGVSIEAGEWAGICAVEVLLSTKTLLGQPTSVDLRPYVGVARDGLELGLESRHETTLDSEGGDFGHVVLLVIGYSL